MSKSSIDYGKENVNRLFGMLFFPTLVAMVFNSMLNIFDGMFVGHGVGSDALAAINIVAPLYLICAGIGLMFGIGASVTGSIRLAENNVKTARILMTQAITAGSIVFGIVILICFFSTKDVLYLLGCSPQLEPYATDYLLWLLPGLFFFYLQCAGMMLIRLDGSPRYAMSVQIIAAVLNIFLDWLLVFPLDMGIMGASIATSFSCVVGGTMVILYFILFSSKLKFTRISLSGSGLTQAIRNIGYMMKIGFATFIAEMALGIMIITGNFMFIKYLGEDGVAAYSIGCYLFPIIFSISNAVAQSAQPIISYNYGAKQPERVKQALKISIIAACICGVVISLTMWQGASPLAQIFLSTETTAYQLAKDGLPLMGCCSLFFALNITLIGYYQSTEHSMLSTSYMLLRGVIFVIPGFILLPQIIGNAGLWLAIPAAEAITLIIITIHYFTRKYYSKSDNVTCD